MAGPLTGPRRTGRGETAAGPRWLLSVLAGAVLVGAASGVTALAPVALLGAVLVAVTVASPVIGVVISVPVLLFNPALAQYPGLSVASYGDEGIILLLALTAVLRIAVGGQRPVWSPIFAWAAAFLALGLISGIVAAVPLSILLPGALLSVKGWLYAWAVAQVDWDRRNLRWLLVATGCVVGFILLTSLINLAVPDTWAGLAGQSLPTEYRWVLPSLIGPFLYAIVYGQVTSLVAGALGTLAATLQGRWRAIAGWAALLTAACALLSFRRLGFLAVLVAVGVVVLVLRSASLTAVLAAAVPVLLVVSWPTLSTIWTDTAGQYLQADSDAARTLLTLRSFDVAAEHFPLGAGFGRYGSFLAGQQYSPEYFRLGFQDVYGLKPTPPDNAFLTDTFWPAVIGESGLLGALCFGIAVIGVLWLGVRLFRRGTGAARVVGLMTATVWIQVLVLSPGGAVLSAGPQLALPCLLLGLTCALSAGSRRASSHPLDRPPAQPGAAALTGPVPEGTPA